MSDEELGGLLLPALAERGGTLGLSSSVGGWRCAGPFWLYALAACFESRAPQRGIWRACDTAVHTGTTGTG